jgi:cell division protein FtsI/penicillin-binding protein 2
MQMIKAFGALANNGVMMQPKVVGEVLGEGAIEISPREVRRVISEETAKTITEMLVSAVDSGEAQWAKLRGYRVAGKTGTAQIAIAGHYDEEKTIASFIGFAPADDPKFVMLVKLKEPTSSPWASETAAPLWMSIAKEMLFHFGIPPKEF